MTKSFRQLLSLIIVGIFLLATGSFSACAQSTPTTPVPETSLPRESSPPPTPGSTPATTEIDISGFAFVAETITIPKGASVTWTNKDSVAHTVSSRDNLFDSVNLSRDATFSHTFTQVGTFEYYCKIHPYMTGKIIIGE